MVEILQNFVAFSEYMNFKKEKDCAFVIVTFLVQLISRIQRWCCYCMAAASQGTQLKKGDVCQNKDRESVDQLTFFAPS